jgi:hypothetical protein
MKAKVRFTQSRKMKAYSLRAIRQTKRSVASSKVRIDRQTVRNKPK